MNTLEVSVRYSNQIKLIEVTINLEDHNPVVPCYTMKKQGFGSKLPGKNFDLGFDILHSPKKVSWNPHALRNKDDPFQKSS